MELKKSSSMNFQENLGHTDATGTAENVFKVTLVFLQCRILTFYI